MRAVLVLLAFAQAGQGTKIPELPPGCADVIKSEPDSRDGFFCRALAEVRTIKRLPPGDPSLDSHIDAAVALFRRTADPRRGPDGDIAALSFIAGLYADIGRFDDAIRTWETVIAAAPDNPESRRQLSATLDRAGRYEEAQRVLREAIPVVQYSETMYSELLELYLRHDEQARALDLATRWAASEPDNFQAHRLVAWYFWDQYKDDVSRIPAEELRQGLMTASAAAERALQIEPRDTTVMQFLEWFLRIRAAIAADPQERATLNGRAREIAAKDDSHSAARPLPKLPVRK